jgi:ribonuclease HII
VPDLVLLDGSHDWLTDPTSDGLLAFAEGAVVTPPVRTLVKADLKCSSVAAASVLAKVERDAMMAALAPSFPQYGWDVNKGYATPEHLAALTELGASEHHRRSWRLPPYEQQLDERFGAPDQAPAAAVVDDGLMTEVAW